MMVPFVPLRIVALVVGAALAALFYGGVGFGEETDLDGPRPAEQQRYFHTGSTWTPLVWGAPDGGMFNRPQYASPTIHRFWFGAPYLQTMVAPPAGSYLARAMNLKQNEFYYRYHVAPGYERWGWSHGIGYAPSQAEMSFGPNVYPSSRAVIVGTPQHPQYSGEALGAHRNLLRFERQSVSSHREMAAAEKLTALGDAQFAKGEFQLALRHYRKATEAAPDYAAAHFRQGFAYVASQRSDFAAAAFRRGLGLEPQWNESRFNLAGLCGESATKYDERAAALRTLAETRTADSDAYFTLGVIHYLKNDDQAAKSYFDAVYHIGGKNAEFLNGFPAGSRGRVEPPAAGG